MEKAVDECSFQAMCAELAASNADKDNAKNVLELYNDKFAKCWKYCARNKENICAEVQLQMKTVMMLMRHWNLEELRFEKVNSRGFKSGPPLPKMPRGIIQVY